ncbi:P-loop containing nucleoside triphosphate hydrolase protein [Naematelia encephala]|uniref:Peroxisomal ATPase PEX6 n=1 Tax=Naematelia encephala TaxID=71784 RepID=A0A1Y2AWL8_9TREE|nr:P-loop containing nucleoside triphosphate hydrolase protein [Naematelia encephala]
MPIPVRRLRRSPGIRAQVEVLLDTAISPLTGSSVGYATTALWKRLALTHNIQSTGEGRQAEHIAVAVQWPLDKRLGNHREDSFVIWVQELREGSRNSADRVLYLPPAALPAYSPPTVVVTLHHHRPVELSLAVLQQVTEDGERPDQEFTPDLKHLFPQSPRRIGANGDHAAQSNRPAGGSIIRQGDILPSSKSPTTRRYRILMLEPVRQGILTPTTKIIISSTPYQITPQIINDDSSEASSSEAHTHLSMANFDPDTFLSSSLDMSFHQPTSLPDGEMLTNGDDIGHSIYSSTSGSITPRPGGTRVLTPPSPVARVEDFEDGDVDGGARFSPVVSEGPSSSANDRGDNVIWLGVGGLGRAGIFEGDWVLLRSTKLADGTLGAGRLVKAMAWEQLDDPSDDIPSNPVVMSPSLHRALFTSYASSNTDVYIQPTSFGARAPTVPIAKAITVSRIATAEASDKRYERSWLLGLREHFSGSQGGKEPEPKSEPPSQLVRRGDIISVPIWVDRPVESGDEGEETSSTDESDVSDGMVSLAPRKGSKPTAIGYFIVTGMSFEPLVPIEDDFRSSISSKARAGELGCYVDVGSGGATKMTLAGVERSRICRRSSDRQSHSIVKVPSPFNLPAAAKLRDLLLSTFSSSSLVSFLYLSILIKGARGGGKSTLVRSVADDIGFNVIEVECFDVIGDTSALISGTISAQLSKVKACAPCILLVKNAEVLAKKSESSATGRSPPAAKILEDAAAELRSACTETGWPCVLIGTCGDEESLVAEIGGVFKHDIKLEAPNELERISILKYHLRAASLAPDITLQQVARQTAALLPIDLASLCLHVQDLALQRAMNTSSRSAGTVQLAGLNLTAADFNSALDAARSSYSDSIGAPKIPQVSWDDVGGLQSVKKEILDTVQLPLERPELFADGLKKRSGILLYGPPGTGKTLLAKAVATSCSLNFFSVKGPELLNMYIGESEANVRRIFQRARDAAPCVIFMDELDSVAPRRGNQGDSGGVMDRIVSQLLAELDGMSTGKGGDVFVMGATNRPDLLDPALLRPGRFDRMLYLSVATSHEAQLGILQALTRKFTLGPQLDLADIAEQCPFNYTGADFYALCSDAMLRAMTRKAEAVNERIAQLNDTPPPHPFPHPLTPQYYLATMASREEMEAKVAREDFEEALARLVPSVSRDEMRHYETVQQEFQAFEIGKG